MASVPKKVHFQSFESYPDTDWGTYREFEMYCHGTKHQHPPGQRCILPQLTRLVRIVTVPRGEEKRLGIQRPHYSRTKNWSRLRANGSDEFTFVKSLGIYNSPAPANPVRPRCKEQRNTPMVPCMWCHRVEEGSNTWHLESPLDSANWTWPDSVPRFSYPDAD
jgi:hypothetical protein